MIARPASRMPASGRTPGRTRAGFTLVELLGVILIIAILIAVALPAFNAVMQNARRTVTRSEMTAIDTSIAQFKAQFNMEPPSFIGFGPVGGPLPVQTQAILRQMFPNIDFSVIEPAIVAAGLRGDDPSNPQPLMGSEALVFFLGGVRSSSTGELVGFSKNPANPFVQPSPGQANRLGPFFEFDSGRLVDSDEDGHLEYVDKFPGQTKPLLYVSTAGTGSYRRNAAGESLDVENAPGWQPYRKGGTATSPSFHNANSHQIVSPGIDGEYGVGGLFNEKTPSTGEDADNLTNFNGGMLGG